MTQPTSAPSAAAVIAQGVDGLSRAVENDVLLLRLDRADKKNALNAEMCFGLAAALDAASGDERIGAVVLTAAGDMFSAGADITLFAGDLTQAAAAPLALLRALHRCAAPVVAAVNGDAVGVGVTLLLHCDFVFAAPAARLTTPFIDLGLCPEGGSSLLFPQILGRGRANAMLMLGEPLLAADAATAGLVDGVADAPFDHALGVAARLAAKPRAAMRATKRLMRAAQDEAVEDTLSTEADLFAERLRSPEAQQAFAAFLAGRRAAKTRTAP